MDSIFDFEGFVPAAVQLALESAYKSKRRIRVWYGYTESHVLAGPERDSVGRSWGDTHEVVGTVGRSTGRVRTPLLVNNRRSLGGAAMMVRSIIRIDDIKSRTRLYQHPSFKSRFENSEPQPMQGVEPGGFTHEVRIDSEIDSGTLAGRFKDQKSAQNFIDFQNGERYSP